MLCRSGPITATGHSRGSSRKTHKTVLTTSKWAAGDEKKDKLR